MKKQEPIQRRKLSHEVKERLLEMIRTGELVEGEQMPSEHDLMDRFSVGRPAVREAMQAIENMGLIEIRHGGRARIKQVTVQDVFSQIDSATQQLLSTSSQNVDDLREARQVFESGVAFLAIQRATDDDIKELKTRLDSMEQSKKNRPKFLKADLDFHKTIAKISRNPILIEVSTAMFEWLSQSHKDYHKDLLGIPELENLTFEEHAKIYQCFAERDAPGAAKEISDHILRVNQSYDRYMKQKSEHSPEK
ncbi:MAG: transcriptional regulator NanR [Desulfotignum sp.]|nr:transcriptional regulator NanR [Desulfotignum sp.]MCF8090657.1 transcriptional regulator NanR [Desulfotignum sp.]